MARFAFRFDDRYARAARPFLITPNRAWVEVADGELDARYGPWRLTTPLGNIESARIDGPYAFAKTAGPARLGVTDAGLTFASNGDRGVLLTFREKVRGRGPFVMLRHPELTVTVEDLDGLVRAVTSG